MKNFTPLPLVFVRVLPLWRTWWARRLRRGYPSSLGPDALDWLSHSLWWLIYYRPRLPQGSCRRCYDSQGPPRRTDPHDVRGPQVPVEGHLRASGRGPRTATVSRFLSWLTAFVCCINDIANLLGRYEIVKCSLIPVIAITRPMGTRRTKPRPGKQITLNDITGVCRLVAIDWATSLVYCPSLQLISRWGTKIVFQVHVVSVKAMSLLLHVRSPISCNGVFFYFIDIIFCNYPIFNCYNT